MKFIKGPLFLLLLIAATIGAAYLVYTLSVFYWSNVDLTDARKFTMRWKEYLLMIVLWISCYAGWRVWFAARKYRS